MTKFYNDLLSKLRANEPAKNPAYYLFLLGTDVNFVPVPDQKEVAPYIRGETFSYAAQATAKLLGQEGVFLKEHAKAGHENYAHAFHSDSVDLINGPNTMGDEAGDRIAKGLLLSLQAIAKGQTEINLSGFSRGAVEAIVLTHELERVKKALEEDAANTTLPKKTLAEIINESNSVPSAIALFRHASYTRQVLTALTGTTVAHEDEEVLKANLLTGLKQLKVNLFVLDPVPGGNFAKIARVGWQESTFYTLPDFVAKKIELVQQHETSNCFKVIIPQGMSFEVIPGSHGTGDGNQFDDTGQIIKAEKTDVSAVQNLVLQRWIEFMSFHVDKDTDFAQKKLVPEHDALNQVCQQYLQATPKERDKLLLASYEKIMENYPAFVFLAGRCYAGLGQLGPIRQVHYHQRGSIPMTDIHQHGDAKSFVNTQHVHLWLSQEIAEFNFFDKPLEEQIAWLKNNLEYIFQAAAQIEGNGAALPNKQLQKILDMTEKEDQAALLIEALATLSNTLILTYLRNNLSEEQLSICHEYFANSIKILQEASLSQQLSEAKQTIAHNFKTAIERGLTTNLHQHSRALLLQTQKQFEDSALLLKQLPSAHEQEQELIKHQAIEGWLVNTQKLLSELDSLSKQIDRLIPYCDQKDMLKALQELTTTSIYTPETKNITELSQKLHSMVDQSIAILKIQAATLLKENPALLNSKQEELEDHFFQEIRLLAKGMGAELTEDKTTKEKMKKIKKTLTVTQETLETTQKERETTKEELKKEKEQNAQLHVQIQELELNKTAIDDKLQLRKAELTSAEENNAKLQEQIQQVTLDKIAVDDQLQLRKAELTSAEENNAKLQEQIQQVTLDKIAVDDQLQLRKAELTSAEENNAKLQEQIQQVTLDKIAVDDQLQLRKAELTSAEENNAKLQEQIQQVTLDKIAVDDQLQLRKAELTSAEENNAKLQEQIQQVTLDKIAVDDQLQLRKTELISAEENNAKLQEQIQQVTLDKIAVDDQLQLRKTELTSAEENNAKLQEQIQQVTLDKIAVDDQLQLRKTELISAEENNAKLQEQIQQVTLDKTAVDDELQLLQGKLTATEQQNTLLQEQMQRDKELTTTEEIKSLQSQLLTAQVENQKLQAQITRDKDNTEKTTLLLQEQVDATKMQKLLKSWQSPEEQQALIKIAQLQEKTNAYHAHLNTQKSKKNLLDEKKMAVSMLKDILDKTDELPSKRLNSFQEKLVETTEKLKEHRDPIWQRFFRDCFRIVSLLVSGIAFARMLTGQSPQFFRPSDGENYVESAESEPKPPSR